RRAFLKAGAMVLSIAVALTLFLSFGLSPIVNSIYYNPAEEVVLQEWENGRTSRARLGIDMGVYTELNYPMVRFDGASVTERGFGDYSFQLFQGITVNGMENRWISGEVQRGVLTMYDSNVLKRVYSNDFCNYQEDGKINQYHRSEYETYWEADVREDVAQMNAAAEEMRTAYISFDHVLTFDELWTLKDETGAENCWNLVDTKGLRNSDNGWSSSRGESYGYWDVFGTQLEEYGDYADPSVRIMPAGMKWDDFERNEELQTAQFLKMLDYLAEEDRKEFLEMMGDWPENYPNAAEYVRDHGLTFLGMAVHADQETLQNLLDHPLVAVVQLKR
ncbi:MAG: anti sigma factor C-terminal domain-containing protein, partial [Firmicutes bacterium]|nr:anti sigma factor C-terminal domain-containing protein [Bacillota bacterium]